MSDPTEREWLEGIGERFEREHEERMSDQLGEALAQEPINRTVAEREQIEAAARNWHALTNPTDELIGRVVWLIRELTEMARRSATDPDWLGSLDATVWTLAILDALAVTADEEAPT